MNNPNAALNSPEIERMAGGLPTPEPVDQILATQFGTALNRIGRVDQMLVDALDGNAKKPQKPARPVSGDALARLLAKALRASLTTEDPIPDTKEN